MNTVSRIESLDALRGLAAIAVVIYHFGFRFAELFPEVGAPMSAVYLGQYGVQLFFLISGFVIYMSLQRASIRSFAVSRFIRLYPIYWVCICVTFTVVTLAELPGRGSSIPEALINFSMLQGYFGVAHVDGAYWTLGVELSFYIQVAALYFVGLLKPQNANTTLYCWLFGATIFSQLHKLLGSNIIGEILGNLAQGFVWIPLFITGIALYRTWNGDRSLWNGLLPVAATLTMGLRGIEIGATVATVILIMAVVLRFSFPRWTRRPLAFLGGISYPLYLIHQNIGYVILLWLFRHGVSRYAAAMVTLTIVLLMAWLLTRCVDEPIRKVLRHRFVSVRSPGSAQ